MLDLNQKNYFFQNWIFFWNSLKKVAEEKRKKHRSDRDKKTQK